MGGWWKQSRKVEISDRQARYSLAITLDAGDVDIDLYSEIEQLIAAHVHAELVADAIIGFCSNADTQPYAGQSRTRVGGAPNVDTGYWLRARQRTFPRSARSHTSRLACNR